MNPLYEFSKRLIKDYADKNHVDHVDLNEDELFSFSMTKNTGFNTTWRNTI